MEERRARQEKVVHREDMTATVGEVLESEHVEEAIELLYKQDELSGKAPPEQSAQGNGEVPHSAMKEIEAEEAPRVESAGNGEEQRWQQAARATRDVEREGGPFASARERDRDASARGRDRDASARRRDRDASAREGDPDASEPRKGVLRFLSPSFMMGASMNATGALLRGARRAYRDLREGARNARHAFDGSRRPTT